MKKLKIKFSSLAVILALFVVPICTFAEENELVVLTGSQDADGVTQDNFNLHFLQSIEIYTKEKVKEKAEAYLQSQGSNKKIDFQSTSVYVKAQHMKLAIVRLSASGSSQVHIYGIKGKELLRVMCMSQNNSSIPISYGRCGDKIREVFKVDLSKGSN